MDTNINNSDFEKRNNSGGLNEREKLLEDFLSGIGDHHPLVQKTKDEEYDLDEPDAEMQAKIERLQKISLSIESKCEQNIKVQLPDTPFQVDYRNCLNDKQLAAVIHKNGPLMVIAGAGSGKTRILVYRVSYLLETGVLPSEILLLTFTRKAAREMLDRVRELLKNFPVTEVSGGTFHSFATHVLKKYANMIGLSPSFTIIDTDDAADTIDLIRAELKLDRKDVEFSEEGTTPGNYFRLAKYITNHFRHNKKKFQWT